VTDYPAFLDLPSADPQRADVLLLPLPYEGTVCHGRGTGRAPLAIWHASQHIECWDEELDWDLDRLQYHSAEPVTADTDRQAEEYLRRVTEAAGELHQYGGLVVGVGGEHSVTPALLAAACPDPEDLSQVTVVQIDAHADLRDQYQGTPLSHACAMRRVLDRNATILAIGIRSADRDEFRYGRDTGRVQTFFAQALAEDPRAEQQLLDALSGTQGDCYLTVDMDGLDSALCPGTGTPQPGGLGWWQTMRYLRRLLGQTARRRWIGVDVVETSPQPQSQVNEISAAKVLTKIIAYHFASRLGPGLGRPPRNPLEIL
jgi:agmatinase